MDPLFSLQNLTYRYDGGTTIFQQFSFSIFPGEKVLLTGPNGVGKTTLLHIISGLLTKGELHYEAFYKGRPIQLSDMRAHLSYVTSETVMFSKLTGYENIECFRLLWKLDRQYTHKAKELCRLLKMEEMLALPVDQYSLGTRQKLHVAISLARPVELYLMDEPFNSLDMVSRDRLTEWIQQDHEAAYLIASHVHQERFPDSRIVSLTRPSGGSETEKSS
ncbi:ABC transporter ATP-binding protein [Geobacillus sp. FSL W8-0032]|uniref:Vitamin B12 import ATP-binding protein BtuD n=1 Tax=Geobacillus icigianus TaxID=1430331 RepID=A0ABU6BHX2_9BACL|nr:ABC transporter ATP-binding protein [Geobacillus icigianus]MEB3751442.1 Vitamin B12 import ATP-binding protein BtuD [Geobacillus icigianus]